jgi:outer membrane protein assembly factor BamB
MHQILNRRLDPPPVEFYLSYVYKEEDRWEVRWEHNLGSDVVGDTDVTTLADKARVYVIVGPTVQALKLSDGAVEWETSLSDEVAATCRECAARAKDRLVVLTDLVLQGVNINSGEVEWSYYYGFGGPTKKGKLININLSDGAINLLLEDPKYAIMPLLKDGGILLVRVSRTKGSEQDELWAVDIPSGEILWQRELQTTDLMGWGSNDAGVWTWTLAPVGGRP